MNRTLRQKGSDGDRLDRFGLRLFYTLRLEFPTLVGYDPAQIFIEFIADVF